MKRYIQLYEDWQREETVTLSSNDGEIILIIRHGKIDSIENNTTCEPNFVTGQPFQIPFIKVWARTNGFTTDLPDHGII